MSRQDNEMPGLSLLGNTATNYPDKYAPQVLETFPNKHPDNEYLVTFHCPNSHPSALRQASPILQKSS